MTHGCTKFAEIGVHPRADAEDEPAFEQRVDHRDLGRGHCGMTVDEIHRAAAEANALRVACERRDEDQARRDRFGEVGHVLADERFLETEPVGEQDRLAVLGERLPTCATRRV
jgi:hypothetical protein